MASKWEDDVPKEVKRQRYHRLTEELMKHSLVYNQALVGTTVKMLVEDFDRKNGYLVDADIISRCRLFLKGGDPTRCARCGTMGDRLYSLRKSKAKTITDASYEMRMDPNELSRFERNMKNPSLKVLRKLAKYYGVTTDYILCMDLYEEEFE